MPARPSTTNLVPPRLTAQAAQERLQVLASPDDAKLLARFFKTGPGQYGEGDIFLGVRVPAVRKIAKEFRDLPTDEVVTLLHSEIHEVRLLALVILVGQFERKVSLRRQIYHLYLKNTRHINNWDLVDVSAPQIVGGWLVDKSRKPLDRMARSSELWRRRIAILATFWFIRQGDFADTLQIAAMLLEDCEDLIHKAAGWMLREVGKRDLPALESFLDVHCRAMPRTMLRYAIERLPEKKRQAYMVAGRKTSR